MTEPETHPSRRNYQFSLRAILIVVTLLSLLLAITAQFPRQAGFLVLMTSLVLFPLAVAAVMRVAVVRVGFIGESWPWRLPGGRQGGILAWISGVLRWLGLTHADGGPSLAAGAAVAIISTLVVVGLWPLLREVGLWFALTTTQPEAYNLADAAHSILECVTSSRYWVRLWQWELWSLGRWWILFGGMTALWLAARAPFSWRTKGDDSARVIARLLAFAPWLVVLETTFLIGVWISSPVTVPEPSTGFVVGIFSWDLWHWDCWLDREWLVRGAVPTLIAGCVFFARVLRWPWPAAVIAAICLIPVALLLSVACTVAWQHGLPWPG
jgi:hypothetical protein